MKYKPMKLSYIISFFSFLLSILNSIAQQTDDCYLTNKAEYENISLKNYKDNYLKPKIEYYFSCNDTIPEPEYFIISKSVPINDSIIRSKTNEGYEIDFSSTKFRKENHTILKNSQGYVCKIDGKAFWGTDENIPREEFKNIKITLNGKNIELPPSEYKDLFNPLLISGGSVEHMKVLKDKKSDYVLIMFYGSDGAGGYAVMWIFNKGKYVRRIIDHIC